MATSDIISREDKGGSNGTVQIWGGRTAALCSAWFYYVSGRGVSSAHITEAEKNHPLFKRVRVRGTLSSRTTKDVGRLE